MRITIDIDEGAGPQPRVSVQNDAQADPAGAAAADSGTAIDAGECADPTAAAFLAERSASTPGDGVSSAGAAPGT